MGRQGFSGMEKARVRDLEGSAGVAFSCPQWREVIHTGGDGFFHQNFTIQKPLASPSQKTAFSIQILYLHHLNILALFSIPQPLPSQSKYPCLLNPQPMPNALIPSQSPHSSQRRANRKLTQHYTCTPPLEIMGCQEQGDPASAQPPPPSVDTPPGSSGDKTTLCGQPLPRMWTKNPKHGEKEPPTPLLGRGREGVPYHCLIITKCKKSELCIQSKMVQLLVSLSDLNGISSTRLQFICYGSFYFFKMPTCAQSS